MTTKKKKNKAINHQKNRNQQFRIVKIIDDETIIINAGSNNGIKKNDRFEILGKGIKVIDPQTKEDLGMLDNIKETVTVTKVFEKMSECSNISTTSAMISLANRITDMYTAPYKKVLNVDKDQINSNELIDNTLRIGDIARKIEVPKSTNN